MEPYSITITGVNFADVANKVFALATELYTLQQPVQQPSVAPAPAPQAVTPTAPAQAQAPVQPQAPAAPAPPAPQAPTEAPKYTLSDLQLAGVPLIDAGKQQQLLQVLNSFGVQALTHLPEAQYGAYATAIRQLGAKI